MPDSKNTILVVDDENQLRKVVCTLLNKKGFKTLEAQSGNEAIRVLKENSKVQLVLSDVRMPDGDGIELVKAIKSINPDLPVVALMTGFSDLDEEELLALGAAQVFRKPFKTKEFIEQITKMCAPVQND